MVDPGDAEAVAAALPAEVERVGGGTDVRLTTTPTPITAATSTWVWFVDMDGDGLDAGLRRPLVLRIYRPRELHVAQREADLGRWLQRCAYPAPSPELLGDADGPLRHPWVIQERVPGVTVLDAVAARPWAVQQLVTDLGTLQARLHATPVDASPLADEGPLSTAFLEHDLRRRRRNVRASSVDGRLAWLEGTSDRFADRTTVVCHGDFHPLNVLVERADGASRYSVVDWTDASRGDPHADVGRSLALYWFAGVATGPAVRRRALGAIAPLLRRRHRRSYESASGTALDDDLLAWWESVHLLRGWLQLQESEEGAVVGPDSGSVAALPHDLQDRLLARFDALRSSLGPG